MSTQPRPRRPSPTQLAKLLYGSAFEPANKGELSQAMAEWSELTEEERTFVSAHLLYLGVQAQHQVLDLLDQLRDELEELVDLQPDLEEDDPTQEVSSTAEPENEVEVAPVEAPSTEAPRAVRHDG